MARIGNIITAAALTAGLAPAATAAPEHLAAIERECGRQLGMAAEGCRCMRDRAAKLNDGQQAFVAAVVLKDKQAQAMTRQKLSVQELTEAGTFLTTASSQCSQR
ncbi:MAG TPA: hypothetical protein VNK48_12290 [Xanthobacteraceae bacterium]|nr:hypothetical protein [Xanthobacteraceae bacterium]